MVRHRVGDGGGEFVFQLLFLGEDGAERDLSFKIRQRHIFIVLFVYAEGFIFCGGSNNRIHHLEGSNVGVPVVLQVLKDGMKARNGSIQVL